MKIKISWKVLSKFYLQSKGLSSYELLDYVFATLSLSENLDQSLQPKGFPPLWTAWICRYVVSRLFFMKTSILDFLIFTLKSLNNNSSIHLSSSSSYKRKYNQKSKSQKSIDVKDEPNSISEKLDKYILHKYNLLANMNWMSFSFITYHKGIIFSYII